MVDMNRAEALAELDRVVPTTDAPTLSGLDVAAVLDASRVVDADGLAPADDGYTETIDVNYAIAEAFDLKALRAASMPQVKKFTAEGASFERILPDFAAMAARYRARSSVGGAGGISVIELEPESPDGLSPRSHRAV